MASPSFTRLATVTASTKRSPALADGKRGAPTTNLPSLSCTPLDPVDPELRQRLQLDTPHELLQTFIDGSLDVHEGDILVVVNIEYPIRACADWTWPVDGLACRHLILEELR